MKIENSWLFATPATVKTAFLEEADGDVHWLNGQASEHNAITKQIGNDKTRQQGLAAAVYAFACNEKGVPLFKGVISLEQLIKKLDHVKVREFGLLIMGYSKGDEKSAFEEGVEDTVKNSETASEVSTS